MRPTLFLVSLALVLMYGAGASADSSSSRKGERVAEASASKHLALYRRDRRLRDRVPRATRNRPIFGAGEVSFRTSRYVGKRVRGLRTWIALSPKRDAICWLTRMSLRCPPMQVITGKGVAASMSHRGGSLLVTAVVADGIRRVKATLNGVARGGRFRRNFVAFRLPDPARPSPALLDISWRAATGEMRHDRWMLPPSG